MRTLFLSCLIGAMLCVGPAHADHFGDIDFSVPTGWQKVEKGGFAILASPLDARGKPRAAIFIARGAGYAGDFGDWFASAVQQGESGEASISRGSIQRIQARGNYEAMTIDSVSADRQGTITHRKYIAANPGGRGELFVYMTYSDKTAQQYLPKLREFLDSVRYGQGRDQAGSSDSPVAASPAPAPRRDTGSHCRTVTR